MLYKIRTDIFSTIGKLYYAKGNEKKAFAWLKRAYNKGNSNIRNVVNYGYLLLRSGNIEDSEKIFNGLNEKAMSKDEKNIVESNIALVLWKKGDLDTAVSMLTNVIKDYKNTIIYGSLGYLLVLKGDLDCALEFNKEAYEYNNSNTIILDNIGQTYYLRGEYEKAEEIYGKLMSMDPAFPEAYYNYGLLKIKKGEINEGIEMMEKSLEYKFSFLSTVTREQIEKELAKHKN
jgi:tetratricopeptide (TPR) repeat protein